MVENFPWPLLVFGLFILSIYGTHLLLEKITGVENALWKAVFLVLLVCLIGTLLYFWVAGALVNQP